MQDELTQAGLNVTILGINEIGLEDGNAFITQGRDLPWLQDVPEQNVWETWGIAFRDVVILDGENKVVAVFNLTQQNLGDPANYAALKSQFESAAQP
jgi:hypothetical protein